jgi:hypothetical protein
MLLRENFMYKYLLDCIIIILKCLIKFVYVFSKQPSNLFMYFTKRVGDMGKPCLTPILQLISSNQPLVFLNLAITFSYNLMQHRST